MANMIMNEVTSIAQTNSGMRLSVMPGARSLNTVVMIDDRLEQRRELGERDHLRPDVDALAGRVLGARPAARRRTSRRPGPMFSDERDVQHQRRRTGRSSSANAFRRGKATLRVPTISGTR